MPLCYVGKATKIFFFLVALLALAGLVIGFGLLRRGWAHKAHGGGPTSTTFPDPLPANATATAPASSARPEPLSPPATVSAASPIASPPPPAAGVPAVGSPPPRSSAVAATNPASPPTFLVPPAPVSNAVSPNGP